jgi:short-subunit dehydrogenase
VNFDKKIILITGASSGIGKALALQLSKENCKLALLARRSELLEQLREELKMPGDNVLTLKCDVSRKEEVVAAHGTIKEKFGMVDVAILNSGVGRTVTAANYDSFFAEETFGANLFGIIYWVEQLLPDFIRRKKGVIAGVSSLADNRGFSGSGFYCASKAALSVYLEGLRIELKSYGIKIITVKPGFVKTQMTEQNKFKMPFLMEPGQAAHIIIDGIKKEKRIIQFPWQMVLMSRIVGLLPGSFYELIAGRTGQH